eukprot:560309_1
MCHLSEFNITHVTRNNGNKTLTFRSDDVRNCEFDNHPEEAANHRFVYYQKSRRLFIFCCHPTCHGQKKLLTTIEEEENALSINDHDLATRFSEMYPQYHYNKTPDANSGEFYKKLFYDPTAAQFDPNTPVRIHVKVVDGVQIETLLSGEFHDNLCMKLQNEINNETDANSIETMTQKKSALMCALKNSNRILGHLAGISKLSIINCFILNRMRWNR